MVANCYTTCRYITCCHITNNNNSMYQTEKHSTPMSQMSLKQCVLKDEGTRQGRYNKLTKVAALLYSIHCIACQYGYKYYDVACKCYPQGYTVALVRWYAPCTDIMMYNKNSVSTTMKLKLCKLHLGRSGDTSCCCFFVVCTHTHYIVYRQYHSIIYLVCI
jgi:hypothetical protein